MRKLLLLYSLFCFLSLHAQNSKMSPFVRQAMMTSRAIAASHSKSLNGSTATEVPTITAFVQTTDISALRKEGCRIYAQWNFATDTSLKENGEENVMQKICIAAIPLDKLSTLANMPQILRIEASESCAIQNDTTAIVTRAKEVWNLSPTLSRVEGNKITGSGVVVGVMDIGFDLTNPTFYTADGKTYRIKKLWDQLDTSEEGESVVGEKNDGEDTILVGRQYIGQEALLARQHTLDGLTQYHGTHTAGTAAGSGWEGSLSNGYNGFYSGMAPDADICLVGNYTGNNKNLVAATDRYKYSTATDMLGFMYIFDYADSVGKPCVINFSEGKCDDLYQSGIYSQVLSNIVGPGRIICASAGNEGDTDGVYMHKSVGEAQKGAFVGQWYSNTVCYVIRSQKPLNMRLSFYKNRVKALDKDYDLTELAQFPDSLMRDSIDIAGDTIVVLLQTYPSCFDSTLYATDIIMQDIHNEKFGYATPTILTVLGEDDDVEVFSGGGYFIKNSIDPSLTDYDNTHCILFPSSVKDVVCVGNCAYRSTFKNTAGEWRMPYDPEEGGVISITSSRGPTIYGGMKPDVVAPGQNVISAMNSFYREENPESKLSDDVRDFTYNNRQYQWHALSGTSMSAPAVTGIIALWLQVCPTLTPDQIKDVFAHTCSHYLESLTYPNYEYGWGQIDALAGLEYIQKTYTGIEEIYNSQSAMHNSDALYTLDGRKVSDMTSTHGIYIVVKNGTTRKVVR